MSDDVVKDVVELARHAVCTTSGTLLGRWNVALLADIHEVRLLPFQESKVHEAEAEVQRVCSLARALRVLPRKTSKAQEAQGWQRFRHNEAGAATILLSKQSIAANCRSARAGLRIQINRILVLLP
jgi:hypothetical protein